jgi:hypothetical protein
MKMSKIYKTYIYEVDGHFEAEVGGITLADFGTTVSELKHEPAVFIHDTKAGVVQQIINALKGIGLSGSLRIVTNGKTYTELGNTFSEDLVYTFANLMGVGWPPEVIKHKMGLSEGMLQSVAQAYFSQQH